MGSVYLYEASAEDFDSIGVCGALMPSDVTFHEIAGGISEVTLEHPFDEYTKYAELTEGRVLKVDVPVRSVPELVNGQFITVVTKAVVLATATKANRYIYSGKDPNKSKKKVKLVPVGAELTIVAKYSNESYRWKVKYTFKSGKKNKTVTGFIDHSTQTIREDSTPIPVDPTPSGLDTVAPSWSVEEQLFTIYSVERHSKDGVTVKARHISYNLMKNLTGYSLDGTASLQTVADGILDGCFIDHDFAFQTNITGDKAGHHYADKDPITAFLDPDTGCIPRWGGQLIRDNFSIVALADAGVNRGVEFRYGKNTKSITQDIDITDVATAIRPFGKYESGKKVYLATSYILDAEYNASPISGDTNGIVYGPMHHVDGGEIVCDSPLPAIASHEGEDCTVNKKSGITEAIVRQRLLAQAIDALKNGAQNAKASIDVDMQQLGYSMQYEQYKALERSFIYDKAKVICPHLGVNIETTITEIEWDCINDRPTSIHFGDIGEVSQKIPSWQISSMNGSKIASGTVTQSQLAPESISTEHMQAESVTAGNIQSRTIVAENIAAGEITGNEINADSVSAKIVETDTFSAKTADIAKAQIGEADIDYAQIKYADIGTGTAERLIMKDAITDKHYIDTLQVSFMQAVDAQITNLVIGYLDEQGARKYAKISIDPDGQLVTTPVSPSEEETGAGVYVDPDTGKQYGIAETTMTVNDLSATSFKAIEAFVGKLTADTIAVDKLVTREITTDGGSITLKTAADRAHALRVEPDGVHVVKANSSNEVLIDNESVKVKVAGSDTAYSSFGANYAKFGNYLMKLTTDGGLSFSVSGNSGVSAWQMRS